MNETEIKYDAPAGAALPRLGDLPQVARTCGPAEQQLRADYYDTDDLRLIRAGITLRRRRGGDDAGWHLKLPAGGDTRREIRLPPGASGQQVPGELASLVLVRTRGEPLRPVAQMTTHRRRLPEPARQAPLTSSSPAGQVVLAYLRAHAEQLKSLDPMVRRDEPDAVHQMRVATRRLRSTLRSFGDIIRRDGTQPLAAELKWLGTVLGTARDAEVLAGHLQARLRQVPGELVIGPVQARVQRHFAPARAGARTALLAELDSQRYLSLLDELDGLLAEPPLTPRAAMPALDALPAAARRSYRQARRRIRRARRAPAGRSAETDLHQARKAAKRARYASEAMTPAIGQDARRFAKQMKRVQTVLGDHQDAVIARQAERELGISAHLAGENAFSYGLLYGQDARDGQRLQAQARQTWKRSSRPRYRRWLQ